LPQTLTYRLMSVYVDDDNQYTTSSFEIDRLGYTYTADSLKSYSQKWRLTCGANNIDLLVSTIHPHYEVQLPFRFYEGPTHITGSVDGIPVQGKGFTELLHSYEKPDISIKPTANLWEESTALNWSLNNPDDGNQVKYDLAYSTDGTYFQAIAYGLEDTVYYWDSSYLPAGTDVWLKVKAYSVDKTLVDSTVVRLVSTTGIEDSGRDKRVRVYPNPNTGYFTLAGEGMRKIEIFDCHGRMVFDSVINDPVYHIDISSEPRGVYLIKIFLPENVISRKIIRL
ncbi:MAG: T9SS type A sorting domain-containing protein, partial [Bacteroidales bacterium]|nr:T9SS type A sorting domain-containing protein [Bacteroidales bacterium]